MQMIRFASCAFVLSLACSSTPATNDGGTDSGGGDGGSTFTQTGTIIDFDNQQGVFDAIVTVTYAGGTSSTTTDDKGAYSLAVPQNIPYTMSVAAGADAGKAYIGLNEQEWKVSGDTARGKTSFVSASTQGLLEAIISPSPDATLALLSVQVIATGACPSATGATISVPGLATDGGTGAVLIYFGGSPSLPDTSATSVTDKLLPSAVIYDLPPTAAYNSVTVTPPAGCTVKAFPVVDDTISTIEYTGNVTLKQAGDSVSFMRIFLE